MTIVSVTECSFCGGEIDLTSSDLFLEPNQVGCTRRCFNLLCDVARLLEYHEVPGQWAGIPYARFTKSTGDKRSYTIARNPAEYPHFP